MIYKITTLFLFSLAISGANFSIIGPCSDNPVFNTQVKTASKTLGELSLQVLEDNSIQNLSSPYGISQIYNSPIGVDAMEVLSDTKMRAHGWCYSVDGQIPELLMSEITLDGTEKEITWFMGYSTYVGNMQTGEHEWVGQCEPSYLLENNPFPEYCQ